MEANVFKLIADIIVDNKDAIKKLNETQNQAQGFGGKMSMLGKTMGVALLGVGTAIAGIGVMAVKSGDELQKALNGVQTSTGMADSAMGNIKDTMLNIYNANLGENFEDIGNAIKTVAQQTGQTGQELENTTKNALVMRDTFEFDVNESIRGSNMLMKQFGMSSDEAYNLIAQGAQNGLDKNGDLLDSVNEYSVHFKQLGFNAEEMFNMLNNGAQSGTFSVDKLGDAVKEFGIRAKDGSKSTMNAFQELGLDANSLSSSFAKGGEEGRKAYELVNKSLMNMQDPLKQNQIGTALWGTMWEDLGVQGIQALSNVEGSIDSTKNALAEINKVKYNTFGEAMEGIKRTLTTSMLIPVSEKLLPVLSNFTNFINKNMPIIKTVITTVFDGIGIIFNALGVVIETFIMPIFSKMSETFQNVGQETQGIFERIFGSETLQKLITFGQNTIAWFISLKEPFQEILNQIFALFQIFMERAKVFWDTYGANIIGVLTALFTTIQTIISVALNLIRDVLGFFIAILQGDWEGAWTHLKNFVGDIFSGIVSIIGNLLNVAWEVVKLGLTRIGDFFSTIFNGIGNVISGIWEGIKANFRGFLNFFIDGLNLMISGVNKIKVNVPDWVPEIGGASIGFNLEKIPRFARGGITPGSPIFAGEQGIEMLMPPKGTKVFNAQETKDILSETNQPTVNIYLTVNGMDLSDKTRIQQLSEELYYYQKNAMIQQAR